jgi:N-acetylglucosaminyl-diphospho-decaprenol L-rhamnosyltransferase
MPMPPLEVQSETPSLQHLKVAVVTVNYRTAQMVLESLQAIEAMRGRFGEVQAFVVDNASPDDSLALMRQGIADHGWAWAHVVASPVNGGFAAGNNLGVKHALAHMAPDYLLFLNPDAVLVGPCLDELVRFCRTRADQALVGAVLLNEAGTTRTSSFRFPSILSEFQRGARLALVDRLFPHARVARDVPAQPERADWVTGACFLVPLGVWQRAGPMDSEYFLYYEEVDYMRHLKALGVESWLNPQAQVFHRAGASTGIVGGRSQRSAMPAYWYQSWRRYFFKNHGAVYAWTAGLAWVAGCGVRALISWVRRGADEAGTPAVLPFVRMALLGRSR